MKIAFLTLLKLLSGTYFLLTSIYCLLAYLPYTYADVIMAPPYAWMPWFARWNAWLYWPILLALAVTCWNARTKIWYYFLFGALAVFGVVITVKPFMPHAQDNNATFFWSLIALLPLAATTIANILSDPFWRRKDETAGVLFEYGTALKVGISISLLYALSTMYSKYAAAHSFEMFQSAYDSELVGWSLVSHISIALIVLSVLNLIRMAAARNSRARALRLAFLAPLMVALLSWGLIRFLANSLSFVGWQAHFYAIYFAFTLTLFAIFVGAPFLTLTRAVLAHKGRRFLLGGLCAGMAIIAFLFPVIVGGADWNGMFQTTFTLIFWLVVAISFYAFRPQRRSYSLATVLGVLILTIFGYQALHASEILWGKPLGLTDDSIARSIDLYATRDTSFDLAHHLLGGGQTEVCGDLCRIMRVYANIRKPIVKNDVNLVSKFVPTTEPRPNIFIFVIDSVRSDYLGAYNPKVDFTPNLDKFAKDSIAIPNTYTQYAGTSLSEPAIWAGALLLHSHYQQPFHKIDGLEKLVEGDGYQMIVSWDVILRQILSPPPDIIKLDTDKPLWNNMEACSTVQQLETTLDNRTDTSRPVFFYAQPENVHQFGKNNLPKRTSENWRLRDGFNNRIAYELNQVDGCLGGFFHYLRAKNLYDNSIIIVTADHGDATGELGR
ncbi:MAG TPA: sulfatase-like hydrolase/transferase, partial [Terriglobales bacterium]